MSNARTVARKRCPVDRVPLELDHVWWWTGYGPTCSERCAHELIRMRERS